MNTPHPPKIKTSNVEKLIAQHQQSAGTPGAEDFARALERLKFQVDLTPEQTQMIDDELGVSGDKLPSGIIVG